MALDKVNEEVIKKPEMNKIIKEIKTVNDEIIKAVKKEKIRGGRKKIEQEKKEAEKLRLEAEQKLKEAEEINRRLKQKLLEETQKRKQGDIKHKEDEVQNDKPKNEKENVKGNIVIEFLVNPDQNDDDWRNFNSKVY